ncbi:chorismate-binding protein [Virgibacillus sp. W0181]|uniref:chorismate-binding protein n=1 Tax=Virgibacillus sp. W0181 TaxID=3391581 RepID=UPI003F45985C
MDTFETNPSLYFNFKNHSGKITPLLFNNAEKVITANKVEDVLPCLKKVQEAVKQGYYAAGYVSYEAAPAFDANNKVLQNNKLPLLWFGLFTKPSSEVIDHKKTFHLDSWDPSVTKEHYNKNVNCILQDIDLGKATQVNYTIPFHSGLEGSALAYYKQLEKAQESNYSAYLNIGDYSILSASPELFFHSYNGKITLKPMKGTVERGKTYEQDVTNKQWLKTSRKNRMENKVIADLMCKDLQKIANERSIQVENPFEIEKYPTVFQMTSTVTGDLLPDVNLIDIFQSLFPSGSITGMPKKESMEVIQALENEPREVYCGAIGYITPDNEAIFNVPIRTVLLDNNTGKASYHAGGGITAHSKVDEEYKEVVAKAKILNKKQVDFQLLESLYLNNGEYFILNQHFKRLSQSAEYFNFQLNLGKVSDGLKDFAAKAGRNNRKVRLLVDKSGKYSIESTELQPLQPKLTVTLSDEPINKENAFYYHKTTKREIYHAHLNNETFDTLMWNTDNEITEFTIGNIVVELHNALLTPPVYSGLLAGTFRGKLLEDGVIKEQTIHKNDLQSCTNIWLINSVRGWVPVHLI